jgi:SAM-dependent methyltransferase
VTAPASSSINFPRFLAEVARVLRPGGHFLYADFRFGAGPDGRDFSGWEGELSYRSYCFRR